MTDLCATGAVTLAGMLRRREVSAREVTAACVQRIEEVDGAVNAVVTRTFDAALDQAARADEALARGAEPGPLHGLPVAHKDLHDTAGVRTTYGSVLFADHVPDRDALVVQRMSQAGAISLGKTNTPEFGAGSHTVNPVFGVTRNPYDLSRSAGGSQRSVENGRREDEVGFLLCKMTPIRKIGVILSGAVLQRSEGSLFFLRILLGSFLQLCTVCR